VIVDALFTHPIPLGEAAAFFLSIKEAAEPLAAEQANEAAFYRQKLTEALAEIDEARGAAAAAEQHAAALSEQATAHAAALGELQEHAMAGAEEASRAHDALVRERHASAALRIAFQEMRGALLSLASQEPPDPSLLAAPPEPALVEPAPQAPVEAPPAKQASAFAPVLRTIKERLPHAAVGGALGALAEGVYAKRDAEPLRARVRELEAKGTPTFGAAMNLAQSKARLALHDALAAHPAAAMLSGAVGGALTGAAVGPDVVRQLGEGAGNLKKLRLLLQR
jgi:head-tail adaptor